MRLKNLKKCYIYRQIITSQDGERTKKWLYKDTKLLNVQQDISELDINSAGTIDFDRIKIRTDYETGINKDDGISFEKLPIENGYATLSPTYIVVANPKVGKTTIYTCETYHVE